MEPAANRRKRNRWGHNASAPDGSSSGTAALSSVKQENSAEKRLGFVVASKALGGGGCQPPSSLLISDEAAVQALLAETDAVLSVQHERPGHAASAIGQPHSSQKKPRTDGDQRQLGDEAEKKDEKVVAIKKDKPNFGLSGALSQDEKRGNTYNGVTLKFREPPEARAPLTRWRLYVFKGEEQLQVLHIAKQSAYLFGRNEDIVDIPLQHPSCSSQHAVLQYRAVPDPATGRTPCKPYMMDLESTNGTFINGVRIDSARYYELKKGDVLKFGASTRDYVLLTENTTSIK